ncbi:MAG: CPBP family intramembrane glutamic endopeptidase [Promethearchaeota archaeon]
MEQLESPKKKIIKTRFIFLFEVIAVFIGIFLIMLIPRFILPLIVDENSLLFIILFFLIRAIGIIIAIPIFILITDIIIESQKKEIIIEEDISPAKGFVKLYNINKNNYKYQFLYGILIFFLIFLPLDFFTYLLIPEMLDYQADSLSSNQLGSYFFETYIIFLISVIIIQICVAIYEESLVRGFIAKRGSENFNDVSAIMIASLYFGLMHFAYFLSPVSKNYSSIFPFIWFAQGFFIGVILALFVLRKKWIIPVIFAHALNNIISAQAVWLHMNGIPFITIALYLYLPLLIIGIILFIWQFPQIKESFSVGFGEFKTYFKMNQKIEKENSDILIRILFDVLIAFLIFILGLFVFGV